MGDIVTDLMDAGFERKQAAAIAAVVRNNDSNKDDKINRTQDDISRMKEDIAEMKASLKPMLGMMIGIYAGAFVGVIAFTLPHLQS